MIKAMPFIALLSSDELALIKVDMLKKQENKWFIGYIKYSWFKKVIALNNPNLQLFAIACALKSNIAKGGPFIMGRNILDDLKLPSRTYYRYLNKLEIQGLISCIRRRKHRAKIILVD